MTRSELEAVAARLVEEARAAHPGAEVSVTVRGGRSANVRFGANEIESCGEVDEETLAVEMAFGRRHARGRTNQLDPAATRALVTRVAAMARVAPEDPEHVPLLTPQAYAAVPDPFDARIAEMPSDRRAASVQGAMAVARQSGLDSAGFLQTDAGEIVVANGAGLRAAHRRTFGSFSMTARARDGSGSGWAMGASHRADDIDLAAIGRTACDKAVRSSRARALDPGKYTVVLEPAAVADLMQGLRSTLAARDVDEGRSALTRPGGGSRVGETIANPIVTLRSDPADPDVPVAPFDDTGLPRRPITWIDRGVLSALSYSRYWAAKQGREPTAAGNWHLGGGQARSIDELVAGVKRGLLVTRLWYIRWLDPHDASVTGLTRDGLFLIEDGRVTGPVNNFRFNQSLLALLGNCDAMTEATWRVTEDWRVPAMRANEFNMASVSEAV